MGEDRRKTAVIMFTDIVGYSAISHRDERLALALLDEHNRIVRGILVAHFGREIKTIGDAFLVEFESAVEAVNCAQALQTTFARRNGEVARNQRLEIRIGMNFGDVVLRDGDVLGDGVNIASRLVNIARGGEICFSASLMAQLAGKIAARPQSMGARRLKNIDTPIHVFRLSDGRIRLTPPRYWRHAVATAIALLAIYLTPYSTDARVVAVLPFATADDFESAYPAEGIAGEIISQLTHVPGVRVLGYDSTKQFKGSPRPPLEIGRDIHAGKVIAGKLARHGDRLSIDVKLVDIVAGADLWSEHYEGTTDDLFRIQREIAARATGLIRKAPERTLASLAPSHEAYLSYLKGRYAIERRTPGNIARSIGFFTRATEIDPSFAAAYDAVAKAYFLQAFYGFASPDEAFGRGLPFAEKALLINPDSPQSHVFIGMKKAAVDHDWAGAEIALREAVELAPGSAAVHQWNATLLAAMGRFEEAKRESATAVAADPLSLKMLLSAGTVHALAREHARVVAICRNILAMDPKQPFAHFTLGIARFEMGARKDAIADLRRATSLSDGAMMPLAALGYVLARSGHEDEARTILSDIRARARTSYVSHYHLAEILEGLGRHDEAVTELATAADAHDTHVIFLRVDPFFDGLHAKPSFRALLQRLRL